MKKISLLFFVLFLISCNSVSDEDIKNLNGYWEIKQVKLENGETKDYKVNETIDYIQVENNAGFRQKVMPQFDGTFRTNTLKDVIKIVKAKDAYFIENKTPYGIWKEQILKLEDSTLVLKNQQNLEYTYEKFKPFSFK